MNNIDHFTYFIEAVKRDSITKAAEALFISQPTISKAIRSLEKEYNTELIDRRAKRFKLTTAGETFYSSASKIVSNFRQETEILTTLLQSKRGTLTLGIPPVTITIIYSIINQFRHMYPEIILNIQEVGAQTAYSLAKAGAVDVAVIIEPFEDADFHRIPMMQSEAVCVVSRGHRLSNYDSISFSQLQEEHFLMLDSSFMLHDNIIAACEKAGFTPHISLQSYQWDLLVEAADGGEGITILPKPIVDRFCQFQVKQIRLQDPEISWIPIAIYHKEKFVSMPMKLFFDLLQYRKRYIMP
ncbi:MAG: LysR family transcriptional regulator [Megasphaera sp.]|jgi:DNA-binding transcriptional LysR family regulator|nr:LysR family transcriptional regulator [Megasphaera sp.]MCH4187945.1 LysR family transcriptional regulator [Megasphaera sp.]